MMEVDDESSQWIVFKGWNMLQSLQQIKTHQDALNTVWETAMPCMWAAGWNDHRDSTLWFQWNEMNGNTTFPQCNQAWRRTDTVAGTVMVTIKVRKVRKKSFHNGLLWTLSFFFFCTMQLRRPGEINEEEMLKHRSTCLTPQLPTTIEKTRNRGKTEEKSIADHRFYIPWEKEVFLIVHLQSNLNHSSY